MTDTTERRSRRTRLVVILVAWAVAIGGFVTWRVVTDSAVDDEADAIETQLRRAWRPVDLVALEDRFLDAQMDDDETGGNTAFALFPQPEDGEFFSGGFVSSNEFVARYTVDTGFAGHGCVAIRVRGPVPNQLTFAAPRRLLSGNRAGIRARGSSSERSVPLDMVIGAAPRLLSPAATVTVTR